jgi:hypothetical protein
VIRRISSLIVLQGLLAAACDPVIAVKGVVRDPRGQPLEDVTVTLTAERRGPHATATAKDGSFAIGMVGAKPEQTTVGFEKRGYRAVQKGLGTERTAVFNITLEPMNGSR